MASWLLYSNDGQHLGPVPTEYVARAVKSGAVPPNRWVTEAGRTEWRPLIEVPEIRAMLESMSGGQRNREHTVVASAEAFPAFPSAFSTPPITEKEGPLSSGPESSDRTVIAPTTFDAEAPSEEPRTTPRHPDQQITLQERRPPATSPMPGAPPPGAPAAPPGPPIGFDATLRSPDAVVGLAPQRGGQVIVEADTVTAPAAAWMKPAPMAPPPQRPPIIEAIVNPTPPRVQTPLPRTPSQNPPAKDIIRAPQQRVSRNPSSSPSVSSTSGDAGGSVLAFFLGGLALGAIVVVAVLVWAFRGGLLR